MKVTLSAQVGPSLYEHPLAGGRENSFFPQLFTSSHPPPSALD